MPALELTTLIGCPLKCTFCPQDRLREAYTDSVRSLTEETLSVVLQKLPSDVRIVFSGFTEPWANKNCNTFVEMCLRQGRQIAIYTTLTHITLVHAIQLVDLLNSHKSQVEEVWIHMPDAHGNMPGFSYSTEYEQVLTYVKKVLDPSFMTMSADKRIDPNINIDVKPVNWYLHTRANNVDVIKIKESTYNPAPRYEFVTECTRERDYRANVLLPNGDVVLCCMDYGLKHKLGNLLTDTYDQLMNGAEMNKVKRLAGSIAYTDDLLCKSCNDAHCRTPWNDSEVYELVKKQHPDILGL